MNTLKAIKASMIIMGILIIAAFGLIINKIAQKNEVGNVKSTAAFTQIEIPTEEDISSLSPCGAYACVLATGAARESRLFVINPENGQIVRTVKFIKKD